MSTYILKFFTFGAIAFLFSFPLLSFAQTPTQPVGGTPTQPISMSIKIENPFNCTGTSCTLKGLIEKIVNEILIPVGGVVATVMIIWAGFLYVTAGGDQSQITKAHQALTWTVVGAAILLGAWTISRAIGVTIDALK